MSWPKRTLKHFTALLNPQPTRMPACYLSPMARPQRLRRFICAALVAPIIGVASGNQQTMTRNATLEELINDMQGAHEGRMHGVPATYDWSRGPRLGMGNNPRTFRTILAWGQLYEAAEGNPAKNTRVQIKDIEIHVLDRAGRWQRVQFSSTVQGSAYVEDFAGDVHRPADLRPEPDGGVSVTAGGGYNFHFWSPEGRADIDPANIAGVVSRFKARLILADPNKPDDRSSAKYVASAGADYWLSKTAPWDNFKTNGDVGIGKAKYLRSEWRVFSMHTLTPEALRKNPPPL